MLYRLYFTSFPYQALVCRAVSMQDAQRKARNYIRIWNLDASIDRIEKMTDAEEKQYLAEHCDLL